MKGQRMVQPRTTDIVSPLLVLFVRSLCLSYLERLSRNPLRRHVDGEGKAVGDENVLTMLNRVE